MITIYTIKILGLRTNLTEVLRRHTTPVDRNIKNIFLFTKKIVTILARKLLPCN